MITFKGRFVFKPYKLKGNTKTLKEGVSVLSNKKGTFYKLKKYVSVI